MMYLISNAFVIFTVPKIIKTLPSPSSENPPKINGKTKESKEMESVL